MGECFETNQYLVKLCLSPFSLHSSHGPESACTDKHKKISSVNRDCTNWQLFPKTIHGVQKFAMNNLRMVNNYVKPDQFKFIHTDLL